MYSLVCSEDVVVAPGSTALLQLKIPFKLKKSQVAIATIRPILAHSGITLVCPMYFISKGTTELSAVIINNADRTFKIVAEDTPILNAVILDTYAGTLL